MNKIYVIMKGIYSDRHACAATTDKERAEALRVIYSDEYNIADIETYYDGVICGEMNIPWIYYPDENFARIIELCDSDMAGFEDGKVLIGSNDSAYGIYVYAPDKEHAEKKAQDLLAVHNAMMVGIV